MFKVKIMGFSKIASSFLDRDFAVTVAYLGKSKQRAFKRKRSLIYLVHETLVKARLTLC